MARVKYPWRNLFRICCNAIALTSNFVAITLLPLATVNAVGFSRPLVTMAMAVVFLGEKVSRYRWVGACLAFVGVLVVIGPGGAEINAGVLVVLVSVVFGALAVIQTRALRQENTTVMMVFYTVGLAVITAVPAIWTWKPVMPLDWGRCSPSACLRKWGNIASCGPIASLTPVFWRPLDICRFCS